ncbi:CPBP family intramembrane glutamic endopeptidase [Agromyces sp. MMS24-JH15]|uniref:CPBP family intramembrane glutamic endopeptidase n=1 Tax=Agromyces sp. MMS24-JH15 TaxID=3243765 RepID=UPI003749C7B0
MASPQPTSRPGGRASTRTGRGRFGDAAWGLAAAAVAMLAWQAATRTWVMDPVVQVAGAYLSVWIPLAAASLVAVFVHGSGSPARDLGLRFGWIDPLWGLGVGMLAAGLAALVGRWLTGAAGAAVLDPGPWAWLTLGIVPIVIAPVIEETYFRGLLQPAVAERTRHAGASPITAAATGVIVSALCFAALHALAAPTPISALLAAIAPFAVGVGCGILTVLTGRIGGAIIAHAVANAAVLWMR